MSKVIGSTTVCVTILLLFALPVCASFSEGRGASVAIGPVPPPDIDIETLAIGPVPPPDIDIETFSA